jgi:hypothetical protein
MATQTHALLRQTIIGYGAEVNMETIPNVAMKNVAILI